MQLIEEKLLTRDQFREKTLALKNGKCVFCDNPAEDAHHIIERRLFTDGGYYLSNGAAVCGYHHMECEKTTISVEEVREACGITKFTLPAHMYYDQKYDKWGNIVQVNGTRLRGELFDDESVQKILKEGGVLESFVDEVKYPRTHHLPWSPGMNNDDRMLSSTKQFEGKRVIVMEKMDGENTSMYRHYYHARSVDSTHHPSRDRVKAIWGNICGDIPERWRICGENLYAKHSIFYSDLESYFYGFSIWDETNHTLGHDLTVEWFELFGIPMPKVLYDGIYDEKKIRDLEKTLDFSKCEGYVLSLAEKIHYSEFKQYVAKYVRKNHVQTDAHWAHGRRIEPNGLNKSGISYEE